MTTGRMPLWRKIVITLCFLIIIATLILVGQTKNVIQYNINGVPVEEFEYNSETFKELHIGNISYYNKDGLLDSMTSDGIKVTIGNTAWYYEGADDLEYKREDFGNLLCVLSYENDIAEDPNNGEQAELWIFSPTEAQYNTTYRAMEFGASPKLKEIDDFKPHRALSSGPMARLKGDSVEYGERIYIFGNDRIYCFSFTNAKIFGKYRKVEKEKKEKKSMEAFTKFNKRCLSVIKNFDLNSYPSYNKYEYLKQKESNERVHFKLILYLFTIILSILIYILSIHKLGGANKQAKGLTIYCIVCFAFGIIGTIFALINGVPNEYKYESLIWISCAFVPSVILDSTIVRFLSTKSCEVYEKSWIIPYWVINTFGLRKGYKKRLLMALLFYPLFYVVPLPMGIFFFGFYIIPITVFYLLAYSVYWIIFGKNVNSNRVLESSNTQLFCRYCGKPLYKDSEYCPYCGKKQ